ILHRRELFDGYRVRVARPAYPVPLMAVARPVDPLELETPSALGRWAAAAAEFCRQRPLGAIGAGAILFLFVVAALAPVISAYDPLAVHFDAMLARPSALHWLGTDAFGRDVLARLIYGSPTALLLGLGSAIVRGAPRTLLRVGSASFRRRGAPHLHPPPDAFLAFP